MEAARVIGRVKCWHEIVSASKAAAHDLGSCGDDEALRVTRCAKTGDIKRVQIITAPAGTIRAGFMSERR